MTMTNKGSFKAIGKESIVEEYTDGIKIYLESTDDQFIFKEKWFSRFNDKLSFESVSDTRANGGCELVRQKVKNSKITAFGVVDRDTLLKDPDFQDSLWWEIDDEVFSSRKPYGETIFVLHRWELENYLLHPQALASLVADKRLDATTSATDIAKLLFDREDEMVAVTLLSTIPAKNCIAQAGEQVLRDKLGDDLKQAVKNKLQAQSDVIESEQIKIKNFVENEQDHIKRWHRLSRLLDGKRIMYRIDDLLFSGKVKLESERGVLAGYIAKHKLVDSALTNWLEGIYHSAIVS
ncbi:hypothetical protein [Methylobacter luteus]|uniref:hypothetical protein n=1 Tax=Methylobacter luteus TaxID=415 RepID=UPI0004222A9C|nr:hypothetical protein [Methylobacter luteus]